MDEKKETFTTFEEYFALFPEEVREQLMKMRKVIHAAAPDATEKISYQMPTFFLNGNLVHFAAFKNHIGFYPAPTGVEEFKDELAKYAGAKGSIRFPLDQPIPYDLVERITAFRAAENRAKAGKKKTTKG